MEDYFKNFKMQQQQQYNTIKLNGCGKFGNFTSKSLTFGVVLLIGLLVFIMVI